MTIQAPPVMFTIQTWSYVLENFRCVTFQTRLANGGTHGPQDCPADVSAALHNVK
jgi:hypothetical protein